MVARRSQPPTPRRRVGEIIRASVTDDAWATGSDRLGRLLTGGPAPHIEAAAVFHGVVGYVHHAVQRTQAASPSVAEMLRDHYHGALLAHARALHDLRAVVPALAQRGIRVVVVKGPALAETIHPRADLRSYGDLDLVVPPEQFPEALEALEALGGRVEGHTDWVDMLFHRAGEVSLVMPSGGVVDLHWHLLQDRHIRGAFRFPTSEAVLRSVPSKLGGVDVAVLDRTDTLLHVAIHAVVSGGHRIVWLADVDRCIRRGISWPEVVARGADRGLGLPLAMVLGKARAVVAAPVPREVPRSAADARGWLGLAAATRRLWPPQRSVGRGTPDRMVSRATSADAAMSWHNLLTRTRGWARERASAPPVTAPVMPDASARRSYLQMVDRHARDEPA